MSLTSEVATLYDGEVEQLLGLLTTQASSRISNPRL